MRWNCSTLKIALAMNKESLINKDKNGFYLDARDVPYLFIPMNEVAVLKIKLLDKDWFLLSNFCKSIGKKPNGKAWAKKLNKLEVDHAVRIWYFGGGRPMWFATEEGLHQIFDEVIQVNSLKLPL